MIYMFDQYHEAYATDEFQLRKYAHKYLAKIHNTTDIEITNIEFPTNASHSEYSQGYIHYKAQNEFDVVEGMIVFRCIPMFDAMTEIK